MKSYYLVQEEKKGNRQEALEDWTDGARTLRVSQSFRHWRTMIARRHASGVLRVLHALETELCDGAIIVPKERPLERRYQTAAKRLDIP